MTEFKGAKLAIPLTFETHQLSEGFSSIVYDAHGMAIDTHLSEAQAETIITAVNAYDKQRALIETLTAALAECEDYFDNRADADCDQDGFIPNEEMKRLQGVREALAAAKEQSA